jgi:hypothetical protein
MSDTSAINEPLVVVAGETIPYKKERALLLILLGLFVIALGGGCWALHFAIEDWLEWKLLIYGGIVLPAVGLVMIFMAVRTLVRHESHVLVIGGDRLQIVVNEHQVVEQYSYDDVRGYEPKGKVIGIDLRNEVSAKTRKPKEYLRGYLQQTYGYDAIIEARIDCPPDELLTKLRSRLEKFRSGARHA